jgi:hypothetical protein
VPIALTTDDPGIERIELTDEFVRAVTDYALTYAEIKDIVRNSLEYSFLPRVQACGLRRVIIRGARKGGTRMGLGAAVSGVRSKLLDCERPRAALICDKAHADCLTAQEQCAKAKQRLCGLNRGSQFSGEGAETLA